MKRQRGRNRGGGGGNTGGGGGGKPQHNANRAFDSNGPDGVKIRGAAQHVYEKYQQLARDAGSAGDRVLAENYLQHAEHYFRTLRAMQPQRPVSEIVGRDQFVSGYDIDFEDESGVNEAAESESEAESNENEQPRTENRGDRPDRDRQDRDRQDRYEAPGQGQNRDRQDRYEGQGGGQGQNRDRDRNFRDDRPQRDDRPRDDRPRDDYRARDDRPRDDRPRDDRPRDDRPRDERPRDDQPRGDRPRDRNFRDRDRFNRDDRPARPENRDSQNRDSQNRDPLGVIEPEATPLTQPREPAPARELPVRDAPVAREPREPRTPREPREAPARMLRADDGDVSHAPAFLQARPPERLGDAADETPAAEAKKPRRRRAPRSFEGGEGAPATADADEG